jgi:predicted aspartyl protease
MRPDAHGRSVENGGATLAASVPEAATRQASARARIASLYFELNGRPFPLPLVHGSIEGEPVWMLVDTGANSHVIASWVARRVGMKLRALGDVGSDHTGKPVSASWVEHPRVAVDDWGSIGDGPMLVTDVPDAIAKIGIGGFVSPQALVQRDYGIVVDFASRRMQEMHWDEAVRAVDEGGGRVMAPDGARLCEDSGSRIRGVAFVVSASVEGRKVDLLLDTGAEHTDLLSTSETGLLLAGRSSPSREPMYAASGLVRARRVQGAALRLGDWALTTDIDLVPGKADAACPRDGAISMDVLASCRIALSRRKLTARCGP